jgi:hypothetical protein
VLQSGVARVAFIPYRLLPNLLALLACTQHLDCSHPVKSGEMTRTEAVGRNRTFWTWFVSPPPGLFCMQSPGDQVTDMTVVAW